MGKLIYTDVTWENLDWNMFQTRIFSLQCRIYEAMEQNAIGEVFRLQNLVLLNPASYWLAVRAVASNDSRINLPLATITFLLRNPKFFSKLIKNILFGFNKYYVIENSLELFFDKRVIEFVWRLALDPPHEVGFSHTAYGLRPGRSYFNLQQELISSLHILRFESRYQKIVSVQIDMPFSSLDSGRLLSRIVLSSKYKRYFNHVLKGCLYENSMYLLPLVLHLVLDGIENTGVTSHLLEPSFSPFQAPKHVFRYANNVLFLLPFYENEALVIDNLIRFLSIRGLSLKQCSISIVDLKQGFIFLDWLFKSDYSGRILVYPTFTNCKTYTQKIKATLRNTYYPINNRLARLASISKEWVYFNRLCTSNIGKYKFSFLKIWCRSYLRVNTQLTSAAIEKSLASVFI